MRTYLVVIDDTEQARPALAFAARRAARNNGAVEILALTPPQEFVQWSGVQAAMEEEAKLRAEAMVLEASGAIFEEAKLHPSIIVREGDPVKNLLEVLKDRSNLAALILAAPAEGRAAPLISHFAAAAASLPCPLIIVPGHLPDELL